MLLHFVCYKLTFSVAKVVDDAFKTLTILGQVTNKELFKCHRESDTTPTFKNHLVLITLLE